MGVKLLLAKAHIEGIRGFDVYRREGGYQSVEKALKQMSPDSVTEEVKKVACVAEVERVFLQV